MASHHRRGESSSYLSMTNLLSVIGENFCTPYPIELTIVRKVSTMPDHQLYLAITDPNEDILFSLPDKSSLSRHDRRLLLDSSHNPLVSLQHKTLSVHKRWQVFRGDKDSEDLIFSTRKSSLVHFNHDDVDVFLASNSKEDECDFKVKGSWCDRTCTIHIGESSTIIAQMHKEHSLRSVVLGKDMFSVTVYPNVDQAFIVCLIVILNEINSDDEEDEDEDSDSDKDKDKDD